MIGLGKSIFSNLDHDRPFLYICNGLLKYIDFEYSGYDDISKLICDWVVHPNYQWNEHQEKLLEEYLLDEFIDDGGWVQRTKSIKQLIKLKWCIIIMSREEVNEQQYRYIEDTLLAKHRGGST